MRTLIIDAMQQRLEYTKRLASRMGHTVIGAGRDGFWAMMLWKRATPELVIIDADLPSPTCDRVVSALRSAHPSALVLIGAGNGSATGPLSGDPRSYVLRKPFTETSIADALKLMSAAGPAPVPTARRSA